MRTLKHAGEGEARAGHGKGGPEVGPPEYGL